MSPLPSDSSPDDSLWRRLTKPRLDDWPARHAFVPRLTCQRILDTCSWGICCYMLLTASRQLIHLSRGHTTWMFYVVPPFLVLQLLAAFFRGLPFGVRFGVLMLNLGKAFLFGIMGWNITDGIVFSGLAMVILTLIFYGPRAAYLLLSLLGIIYAVVAWGWSTGVLPYVPGISHERWREFYSAFHSGVWVTSGLGLMALFLLTIFLFQYVLRHLQTSNAETVRALRELTLEQEQRARAEAASLRSELALRETQKFDALGRLASGVAHDVNNALTVVKCWSTLLAEMPRDAETKEALSQISAATNNAAEITSSLLAFSRNDPQKRVATDFSALLQRETKNFTRLLPPGISVQTDFQPKLHVRLGDSQLQEMALNLALNARDAMPDGGRLTMRLCSEEIVPGASALPSGPYVRFEISDTGIGMDVATQTRIFEPFFTTKGPGKGTGLGLAMVFGLVNNAGGQVEVHSTPGAGTTFAVLLPKADPGELRTARPPVQISTPLRCSVLVAEDYAEVRLLIEQILVQDGFPVTAAADGDEAMHMLLQSGTSFGLLIIDGIMPGRPSNDVIRTALSINPSCRIVICSAHMRDELLQRGIEDGRYLRLAKPFGPDELRAILNQALGS